ncbi:MAG: helix-turn-helix domain-containing protein, partial [Clostridioides sp.]|nr:helix-turn-helix domain-containing protein [Clostridioides sp.]
MNTYLEKEDFLKLKLFIYINNTKEKKAHINTIKHDLGISVFLVKKSFEGLKKDLEEYNFKDYFDINMENRIIEMTKYRNFSSTLLLSHYVKKSYKYKFLLSCMLEDIKDVDTFAHNEFISLTKAYYIRQEFETFFNNKNINISSNMKLQGDEKIIRYFLYKFYFIYFNGSEFVFDEKYKEIANELLDTISPILFSNITETQYRELLYFLSITFLRLEKKHFVSTCVDNRKQKDKKVELENFFSNEQGSVVYKKLKSFFNKYFDISNSQLFSECEVLFAFMFVCDFPIRDNFVRSLFAEDEQHKKVEKALITFEKELNFHFGYINKISLTTPLLKEIYKIFF